MNNVAFLFGAGAEARGNFDLPSGDDYVKETIENPDKEFLEVIRQKFGFSDTDTIINEDYINIKIVRLIAYRVKKSFKGIYEYINNDNVFKKKKRYSKRYKKIVHAIEKYDFNSVNSAFLKSLKIGGKSQFYGAFLDSIFNSFARERPKAGSDASKQFQYLFYYYWLCYYSIFRRIYKLINGKEHILNQNFIEKSRDDQKEFYKDDVLQTLKKKYKESYYSLINKALKENDDIVTLTGIATSNYFNLCKIVDEKKDIAFLNGSLKMFEQPTKLRVYDRNNEKDSNGLFIPFLLGVSYVKPIICSYQIEEFNKFKKYLEDSDVLVVLGYSFGETDNHINAVVKEFYENKGKKTNKKRHKIIIFVCKNEKEFEKQKSSVDLKGNRTHIHAVYFDKSSNKKVVEDIFDIIREKGFN